MDPAANLLAPLMAVLGGWEVTLILTVLMILLVARKLSQLSKGLGSGLLDEFKKATHEVADEMRSEEKTSGLVYEAITTDNRTADFVYPQAEGPNFFRSLILFLAQGFGAGRISVAPGTFGSIVGVGWVAVLVGTGNYWYYLAGTIAGVALAVWICGAAEKILKQTDPPSVVLDEIVAMPVCFLPWVTHAWRSHESVRVEDFFSGQAVLGTVAVFVLFRLFDIAKPWPVRQSQRLSGGWGVVLDDILAAAYVALVLTLFFVGWA